MSFKKLRGKDGEIALIHKGVVFANAERFTAELIERTALIDTEKAGTYSIETGYRVKLCLNDVVVTDEDVISAIMKELDKGFMPELGFKGLFRRSDGLAERIVFRDCALIGELDYTGLIKGFVWDMGLAVNGLTKGLIEETAKKRGRSNSDNGHFIYPGTVLTIP